jgi:hypothetical protein
MDKNKKEQRISIRFPWDVLEVIRQRAQSHERSFNGEVIWLLRFALTQEKHEHRQNLPTE